MPITSGDIVTDTEEYVQKHYPQLLKESMWNIFSKGLVEYLQERGWHENTIAQTLAVSMNVFNRSNGGPSNNSNRYGEIEDMVRYKKYVDSEENN